MAFSGFALPVGAPLVDGRVATTRAAGRVDPRGAGLSFRAPDARPEPARTVTAPTCTQSLQALIDATPPGGRLQLPGCVFRASAGIERPITVVGSAGTEIRGSDVWTRWRASNGRWISADGLPSRDRAGECRADQPGCGQRRQVFVDGRRLVEAAEPSATAFAVTADDHVALGFDPAGRTVEVSVRDRWLDVRAAGVTIRAVTFRHAINAPQAEQAALRVEDSDGFSLLDSTLADAHGSLLGVDGGSRLLVQGNDLGDAGQEGFAITRAADGLVAQNRIHDNNTAGFDPEWEAGGGKATRVRGVRFESNEVTNNAGPGLWCDIDCERVTMSGNRVSGNERAGLFYEISTDGRIADNVVWSNGWGKTELGWGAGILISSSGGTSVDGNVVAWNADGISVVSQDRADAPRTAGSAIEVRDNLVVVGQDASRPYALAWLDDGGPSLSATARGNAASGNRFWAPPGSLRFAWDGEHDDVASFSRLPGGHDSSLVPEADRDARLTSASVPTVSTPHPAGGPDRILSGSSARRILVIAGAGTVGAIILIAIAVVALRRRATRRSPGRDEEPAG